LGLVYGTSKNDASLEADELQIKPFREILQNARTFINAWNGTLYFVYLPAWKRYAMPWSVGENRDAILALVKGLNIPIIDIHQAFRAHADSLRLFPFRRPGHYNEEGHLLVAETVLRHLSSHSSGCEPSGSRTGDCSGRSEYSRE
jgi:hypothetical protein